MSKPKITIASILQSKGFCLFWLIFGFLYVTCYGMLYVDPNDPLIPEAMKISFFGLLDIDPLMTHTASVIGRGYFWGFKLWGLFQAVSLVLNIAYLYRRYSYKNRAGTAFMGLGAACIMICVMIPSTEIMSFQLVAHWACALLFGVFFALAIGLLLLHFRKDPRMRITFILFVALLAAMIALLVFVGKSGAIESIPMWGAYLVLLLLNFTNLYKNCLPGATKERTA